MWKWCLGRYNQVQMRSSWIRVNFNPMTCVLIIRGKFGQKHTEADIGVTYPQGMNTKDHWQAQRQGEEHGTDTVSEPPEETNPADNLIWDF